jgi:hypothetical protein
VPETHPAFGVGAHVGGACPACCRRRPRLGSLAPNMASNLAAELPLSALAARLDEPSDLRCGPASAALRYTDGSAPRTAAITAQEGNVERQTPIAAG